MQAHNIDVYQGQWNHICCKRYTRALSPAVSNALDMLMDMLKFGPWLRCRCMCGVKWVWHHPFHTGTAMNCIMGLMSICICC